MEVEALNVADSSSEKKETANVAQSGPATSEASNKGSSRVEDDVVVAC